jgi:hypothetical protein
VAVETNEENEMKFNLENHQVALSHVVLKNTDLCLQLADTPLWKENGILEATLIINGVNVPAELIENTMHDLYAQCEDYYKEKYDAKSFDERVEERAIELLKEHADNALERISRLTEILDNPDVLLTSAWERNHK